MDARKLEKAINKMISKKNIDARFIPFIHIFFQQYNYVYNLTEEQAYSILKKYDENFSETLFVNINNDEIKFDSKTGIMLLDTNLKKGISNKNVKRVLRDSIIQQALIIYANDELDEKKLAFMQYNEQKNLYDKTEKSTNQKSLQANRECLIEKVNSRAQIKKITIDLIEEKVSQLIQKNQYPKTIKPILLAYFERSAKVYNWDSEEFLKKMYNLEKNVKKIEINQMKNSNVSAVFVPKDKKIIIYKDNEIRLFSRNKYYEDILESLFHEIRHATDATIRKKSTFENGMYINLGKNNNFAYWNESYVEGGTQLIIGTKYNGNMKTSLYFNAYNKLSFLTGMLASAIGKSDTSLIKMGEKGITKFIETVSKENYGLAENIEKLALLYTKLYNDFRFDDKSKNTQNYVEIIKIIQEIYDKRMINNPPKTNDEKIKAKYEQYKIYKNFYDLLKLDEIDDKLLKKLMGKDLEELKTKTKLSNEDEKNFLSIANQVEVITYDNSDLIKATKETYREMNKQYKQYKKMENKKQIKLFQICNFTYSDETEKRNKFAEEQKIDVVINKQKGVNKNKLKKTNMVKIFEKQV